MPIGIEKIVVVRNGVEHNWGRFWLSPTFSYEIRAKYYPGTPESKKGFAKWIVKPKSEGPLSKDDKITGVGDSRNVSLEAKYCGIKEYIIEAFVSTPENKFPTQLVFFGKAPEKITKATWSKKRGGSTIGSSKIKYGDKIWLNIQTEGLNGVKLDIEVFSKDTNERASYVYGEKCLHGEINVELKDTYAWRESTGWVTRDSGEDFYIKVNVSGKSKRILNANNEDVHAKYITIKDVISSRKVEKFESAKPLTVEEQEVDVQRYESCGFKKLTITEIGESPITIFEEGKILLDNHEKKKFQASETIFFEYREAVVTVEAKKVLNGLLNILLDNPYVPAQIGAHCDSRGTKEYNQTLSNDRAKAVVNYLVGKGVSKSNLKWKGYGELRPVIKGEPEELTEEEHQENRRVTLEFLVSGGDAESMTYDMVASDVANKKEITIDVDKYLTTTCLKKGDNKHDDEIRVIELTQNGITGPYKYSGNSKVYSKTPRGLTIWPTRADPNLYEYYINSCRYYYDKTKPTLIVNVFPDIEWEIAFILTVGNSYSGKLNYKRDPLNGYHQGYGFNYLKEELTFTGSKTGALAYGINGKYIVNGKEQESSIALKKIKSSVEKATVAYNTVSEYLEIFNPKKATAPSAAVTKGVLDVEFNIEPPSIALALGWKYGHGKNNKELIPIYKGGLKLDPLIGMSIGVDIVPLFGKFSPAGKAVEFIIDSLSYLMDVKVYIIFECFVAVKTELSLSYNKVDGFDKEAGQKAEIEAGIALKAGVNSNDTVFIATTTSGATISTVEVEKWKAEGRVSTSFSFIEEVKYDRSNGKQYRESSVAFNGAKLTLTFYELISKKKVDYDNGTTRTFQIMDKDDSIFKSGKSYLDGN